MNARHHEMFLEKTLTSGMEEWRCPTCGRRFLVQWPPAYKVLILEPGEKDIEHTLSPDKSRVSSGVDVLDEEFRLLPWKNWFEKVDFDSLWGMA